MSPEDRALLERTLKLSEENNKLLVKMQRAAKRAAIWGFIKVLIVVLPLVAGYILLSPYLNKALDSYNVAVDLLNSN